MCVDAKSIDANHLYGRGDDIIWNFLTRAREMFKQSSFLDEVGLYDMIDSIDEVCK